MKIIIKKPDELRSAELLLCKDSSYKVAIPRGKTGDVDENLVIETDPGKNRYVKEGSTITIYYSSGSQKIEIEDYTGQNVYEVKAKLELLGLTVNVEEKEVEAAISEGAKPITLGKRILRTETAGLAILSVLMFQLEN